MANALIDKIRVKSKMCCKFAFRTKNSLLANAPKLNQRLFRLGFLLQQYTDTTYNTLAWVMFDMSSRQFLIAWRKWNQRRKEKKSPRARIQKFLKRLT